MLRFVGMGLILGGLYFIGDHIVFAGPLWGIASGGVFLLLIAGVWRLVSGKTDWLTWAPILVGVGLVFFYSKTFLNPTTLRDLLIASVLLLGGFRLVSGYRAPF